MVEPSEREVGMAEMVGRGAESLNPHESDESLDALEASQGLTADPDPQVSTEGVTDGENGSGPELSQDLFAEPAVPLGPEPEPGDAPEAEEEGVEYVSEGEEGWGEAVLSRAVELLGAGEQDEFSITQREHNLEVENAALKAKQDAAEAQILPSEDATQARAPYVADDPEVVKYFAERYDFSEEDARRLARDQSILADHRSQGLEKKIEALTELVESQKTDADNLLAHTEAQRNLDIGLESAAAEGDLEAVVVDQLLDLRDEARRTNDPTVLKDSFLFKHFTDHPNAPFTHEGVIQAVRSVASNLQALALEQPAEQPGANGPGDSETATGTLVGRRSETTGMMNSMVRQGVDVSSNPQETEDDVLFRGMRAARPGSAELDRFFD